MNSNRSPFQVYRYGHDEGLRSSSSIFTTPRERRRGASAACFRLQDARRPEHADDVGSGAIAQTEDDVGRRRRGRGGVGFVLLPEAARAHLDLRTDGRAVADARGEPDAERPHAALAVVAPHGQARGAARDEIHVGRRHSDHRLPATSRRRATQPSPAGWHAADTSVHSRPRLRSRRGPRAVSRKRSRRPSLS